MLAIETTGPICSVAYLAEDGRVLYRASEEGLMHLTSLIPLVEDILEEAGVKPRKLDCIAVSAGPGSFTGIRIGVATARALAQALDIPVIKVPTLETFVYLSPSVIASEAKQSIDSIGSASGLLRRIAPRNDEQPCEKQKSEVFTVACPVFDARRDQMYAGAYTLEEDGRIMTLVKSGAYDPADYFAALGASLSAFIKLAKQTGGQEAIARCYLMGDGLPVFKEAVDQFISKTLVPCVKYEPAPVVQDARAALAWAVDHGTKVGYGILEPIYIRKAEAQRRLDEKASQEDGSSGSNLCEPQEPSPWLASHWLARPAEESDVYGISVIERLSFGEPWLERSILDDIRLEYSDYIVCEDDGFVMGYAGLHRILEEGHITNIAVHPAVRRRGVGSAALRDLLRTAADQGINSFTLEVRDSDIAAIRFYEKHGFVSEGVRKDYYPVRGGGREDARIMWRRFGV